MNTGPNLAHTGLVELEKYFNVLIITQNIDDLHEKAGSKNILHLHGQLTQARSSTDDTLIYDIGYTPINWGDKCDKGSQLRPHVVWFGEDVPEMNRASSICSNADIFVIIGTSLNVYPAAGLIQYIPPFTPVYVIDPNSVSIPGRNPVFIREKAQQGVSRLITMLMQKKPTS